MLWVQDVQGGKQDQGHKERGGGGLKLYRGAWCKRTICLTPKGISPQHLEGSSLCRGTSERRRVGGRVLRDLRGGLCGQL